MATWRALLVVTALVGAMGIARASDKIEATLYWGRNSNPSILAHQAPEDLSQRLQAVFGFKHYQLMKADKIDLTKAGPQWFKPRKDLAICLRPVKTAEDEPQLVDYEIYQEGFILAKGKYEPSDETPLFISGPNFKNGMLLFVLQARSGG